MIIEITDRQAYVLQKALEVYARLGMGQCSDALDCMPLNTEGLCGWHEDKLTIYSILKRHMRGKVDGWQSSLGICSPNVNEYSRIAWDMYKSIRSVVIRTSKPDTFKVSDEPRVKIS